MNWQLIVILSLFGILIGILGVRGYTVKIEFFLWLTAGIFTALVAARNIQEKVFLHLLIIGLAWGLFNALLQSIFFSNYLANNPSVQENFNKVTFMSPRYFVLITGPVFGLITGAVMGGIALLLKRLI